MSSSKKLDGGIFKLYFDLTNKYTNEYGENTVVLLQVGSFYEMYGMKDKNNLIFGSKIQEVSNICRINVRPKQTKYNDMDIVMAGFPDKEQTLDKFLGHINDGGYTSVIFSQNSENPTLRAFNSVVSPGTFISSEDIKLSNNITCIWFDLYRPSKKRNSILTIGLSNINIITGDSTVFEYDIQYSEKSHTIYDELQRFISVKNPSEVILISQFDQKEIEKIISYAGIQCNTIHSLSTKDKFIKKCTEQVYQYETFKNYFNKQLYSTESQLMYKTIALQSLTFLLDFIFKHNPNLTKSINFPDFDNKGKELILANHTLKQLNIIPDNNYSGKMCSLLTMLNFLKTSIGKRRYEYEITHPSYNTDDLKREYDITEHLLNNYNYVETIRSDLNIDDLSFLVRRAVMKKINPLDITFINKTLIVVKELYEKLITDNKIFQYIYSNVSIQIGNESNAIADKISKSYDISICENFDSYDNLENIFLKGYNKELDTLIEQYDSIWCEVENIRKYFDSCLKGSEKKPSSNDYVKVECTEKKGYCMILTKTRSNKLRTIINTLKEHSKSSLAIDIGEFVFAPSTQNNVTIENEQINEYLSNIDRLKKKIKEKTIELHIDFLDLFEKNKDNFIEIIRFIEVIDNMQNKAFVAKKFNYSKPELLSVLSSSSFVSVKSLRHPLIENIHSEEYISNDLELGREKNGILLYGTNAVGKTSLIRALGMSIVMAQCGYFVPASYFEYSPYKKVFSRILNHDNLFKGLSTFAVEMSELNVILQNCDENSLILGDELCSGTEMDSAKAIFVSGLETIHKNNSTFMFATHLHEIAKYQEICKLDKLTLKHMTVTYDREKDELVYDRILKDGPGESMYGLEVCKSLNMPKDFLENAYKLRSKYIEDVSILDSTKSRYNSSKLINMCEICGLNPATETHHKKQQKDANESGYIDNTHKDHISNLTAICEDCHLNEHKNKDKLSNNIIC